MTDPLAFASYEPNGSASTPDPLPQGDPAGLMAEVAKLPEWQQRMLAAGATAAELSHPAGRAEWSRSMNEAARSFSTLLASPSFVAMIERTRRDRQDMWTEYARRRR